jgi:hypothetical protein
MLDFSPKVERYSTLAHVRPFTSLAVCVPTENAQPIPVHSILKIIMQSKSTNEHMDMMTVAGGQ